MSNPHQKQSKFEVISACFLKLAALKAYQKQWRMNEQWANLLWSHFQDIISLVIDKNEDMDGKVLDASIKKDKIIKINLQNYAEGTNTIGVMCRDYKPTSTLNGREKIGC
jgi:hypothetical protein